VGVILGNGRHIKSYGYDVPRMTCRIEIESRAASGRSSFRTRAGGPRAARSRETASITARDTTPAYSSTAGTSRDSTIERDKAVVRSPATRSFPR